MTAKKLTCPDCGVAMKGKKEKIDIGGFKKSQKTKSTAATVYRCDKCGTKAVRR